MYDGDVERGFTGYRMQFFLRGTDGQEIANAVAADFEMEYDRDNANAVGMTLADGPALPTAFSEGQVFNKTKGRYAIDVYDAAWADEAGVNGVGIMIRHKTLEHIPISRQFRLVNYNRDDAARGTSGTRLDTDVSSRMATTHINATGGVVDQVTLVDQVTVVDGLATAAIQHVADAMRLTPSGMVATDSVDEKLQKTLDDGAKEATLNLGISAILTEGGTGPWSPADVSALALESSVQQVLTDVANVPTVPEFEARTLPAADYFSSLPMTENYPESSAQLRPNEAIYELLQNLTRARNVGDQRIVQDRAGTDVKAYDYDDSANPTSITPAVNP